MPFRWANNPIEPKQVILLPRDLLLDITNVIIALPYPLVDACSEADVGFPSLKPSRPYSQPQQPFRWLDRPSKVYLSLKMF